jgi:hypothetical protein
LNLWKNDRFQSLACEINLQKENESNEENERNCQNSGKDFRASTDRHIPSCSCGEKRNSLNILKTALNVNKTAPLQRKASDESQPTAQGPEFPSLILSAKYLIFL